ncbi:MAG TPA: DinB family protein [Gemmataceae bacterium]
MAKDVIRQALATSRQVFTMLLQDLSDADLLVRPSASANHIAWQIGHVIASEHRMLTNMVPDLAPALPEGFADLHAASTAKDDNGFLTKAEYLAQYGRVRKVTLAALDRLPEADLDRPNPGPTAPIAPTIGALFLLVANHGLLHAGQFSVVRRKLGKPTLF